MAVGMMLAAPLGGSLTGRVEPRYVIALSTLIAAFGMSLFLTLDVRSTAPEIMFAVFTLAFGMGFGIVQRTNIIAAVVPEEEIGISASVLALVRNIAGAFGIPFFFYSYSVHNRGPGHESRVDNGLPDGFLHSISDTCFRSLRSPLPQG